MSYVTSDGISKFLMAVASLQSFSIFCLYLLLILLAPVWQKTVKPLDLKPVLVIYNFACCAISQCTLLGFVYGLFLSGSLFDKTNSRDLRPFYLMYWITKSIELLDTVFMVLRHRQHQVSFLHVYHHSSMLLLSDAAYHSYSYPAIAFYFMINSFVHVMLYLYYGLTALFPQNPPQWKKNMTQLQIVQFLVGFVHSLIGYLHHGFCIYGLLYGFSMTTLFTNFYYNAYIKKKSIKSVE